MPSGCLRRYAAGESGFRQWTVHSGAKLAGIRRLVMDYNNDGWGPDNIDRLFAHETGHIFHCPDEYASSGCDCGGSWGRFGVANRNYAYRAGEWRVEQHPRLLADTTGDGQLDIVGFGEAGVWVSRALGGGTFEPPGLAITNFGYSAGG